MHYAVNKRHNKTTSCADFLTGIVDRLFTIVYLFTYGECLPCPHWFVYSCIMT